MTGFTEISQMENNLLAELRRLNDKMDAMNTIVTDTKAEMRSMKEDIEGYKMHGDRITRLEQRAEDAEGARKSINENIRWLIALIISVLVFVVGLFFKK